MSQISITPLVQHHQYSYKFDNIVATALMNQQNPPMPYSIMRLTIFLLLLMAASSLTPKIYLIGGASLQAQALIFEQLAKLVPQRTPQPNKCDENWQTTACPRIAVATSAAESQAAGDQVYTTDDESGLSYHSLFMLYGMAPKHLSIHRDNFRSHGNISTPQGMANLQTIYQADIVFFNGGDQTRHLRSWLNDDATPNALLSLLRLRAGRHQVILAGSSAGSMIWGLYTFGGGSAFGMLYFRNSVGLAPKNIADAEIGDDAICDTRNGTDSLQYDYNGVVMPAIGLIDFLVDTHFEARGRLGRLPAAMTALRVSLGVGIDQKTAFYYNNGTGTVYGYNGVTICDMSNSIVPPSKYFTATGIEGSYLTAGDSYDFKTKTVISSKREIKTPKYSEATDSNDILDSYQASLLSSRVVDQKALFNLGRTQTPPNFPKETPKFEIKFYRNSQSKGYFNDNKYTVSKILYDYSYGANSFNLRVEEDTK